MEGQPVNGLLGAVDAEFASFNGRWACRVADERTTGLDERSLPS
jgi:hypothetical protein